MATRSRRPSGSHTQSTSADQDKQPIPAMPGLSREEIEAEDRDPRVEVQLHGSLQPLRGRDERIAARAYQLAAERGFEPGHELDDWLTAEREIDATPAVEKITPPVG